ncbi:ligase-associated DNA damage response endonuclease PdeM [Ferruginibacter paludis]|uniref:ligase-associated DNA damage response endonuclease PdeM n=1 Tax=Ferruginibacter TaxID=1004303 RepID=UPI0025B534BC|nr:MULTISPECIES: ligase-associated DNA damage response endonuclease PdeM [Ferruginibacter]MDB5280019.1 metallophosphoesterase [Ferruginibacter sp.]MDN3658052.1 ligase-associated DNA damage response endonuclease PdeM [Ferruginibacter paludis]
MSFVIPHRIYNNTFLLSADRCIFWEEEKILILSDLHLGKTGHFRKAGIAIPQAVFKEDMQRLVSQLQSFKPRQVIIIGDMFHSESNKEHEFFLKWRQDFASLPIHLVKGNHDILKKEWYALADITIHTCELLIGDFVFVHDVVDCTVPDHGYIFSGHIHPAVTIRGLGKQSLSFPCFYFGMRYAVLPAFSKFTGTFTIEPKAGENVFALVKQTIISF